MDAIHGPHVQISSRLSLVSVKAGALGEHWLSLLKAVKLKALRRSPQNAERSSHFEQQEGGTTPPEIETRLPQHWTLSKFFDLELYKKCTGRETPPNGPVKEVWVQVGRGGGKRRAAAAALVATAIKD